MPGVCENMARVVHATAARCPLEACCFNLGETDEVVGLVRKVVHVLESDGDGDAPVILRREGDSADTCRVHSGIGHRTARKHVRPELVEVRSIVADVDVGSAVNVESFQVEPWLRASGGDDDIGAGGANVRGVLEVLKEVGGAENGAESKEHSEQEGEDD